MRETFGRAARNPLQLLHRMLRDPKIQRTDFRGDRGGNGQRESEQTGETFGHAARSVSRPARSKVLVYYRRRFGAKTVIVRLKSDCYANNLGLFCLLAGEGEYEVCFREEIKTEVNS